MIVHETDTRPWKNGRAMSRKSQIHQQIGLKLVI
jgi:hypothetical protein